MGEGSAGSSRLEDIAGERVAGIRERQGKPAFFCPSYPFSEVVT